MKLFLTKNRKNKYTQLKKERDELKQKLKEINNKNSFFRNENSDLHKRLEIAEQMIEERDNKINHILEPTMKWSRN